MLHDLIIGMAGSGGDGIVSAGESLMSAAARDGYYGILTKSFGSQIRGGESSCRFRVATTPVLNPCGALTVAVALNWEDFLRFGSELPVDADTVVIYEQKTGVEPAAIPLSVRPAIVLPAPIEELAKKSAGTLQAKNNVVLGLLAGWFGLGRESILAGIRKKFGKKGAEVLAGNERAFAAGLAYADERPIDPAKRLAPPTSSGGQRRVTDGNEVCAEAALFAGCKFFGGYPITPATEIMQHLQRDIWKHGGSLLQAEDEIAGVAAAIGASFAGVKAMTATSGPGFSLKAEALGLASGVELPLVCVNVQRGGPSTGLPTKSEQADLFAAAFSAHGDSVRPILAPISVEDTFGVTVEAFNIAEEFQTPVIVLSDQEIAQRKDIINPVDTRPFKLVERLKPTAQELEDYTRFRFTESGISPISHPGMKGGSYLAAGIEHNEAGAPTSSGAMHGRMNDKRLHKMNPLKQRRDLFVLEGDATRPSD
ncbi:2-oxoacid:acceptor oxidoreductase family protein [Opitutus terrae]|uniref:Pyruvate flavodoxin/ferredoxin oxidoreductase domain protein n=1 Tax=Opitutus terrae (strain DSM 11246 / JCM 15787 / PB90-1) TaxID=452637 RepID=B1ZUI6_OPITP|nr:2-oxoacid:acceptor oxidoreductase family protein [Opitutus terrae]ACB74029.1 pyruvate flavodoxin/ferredoxin oxidoreductase domain protein [Opitutus terrae PB90-1]